MAHYNKQQATERQREMQFHHEWAERRWRMAFNEDWDYEYLLEVIRAKLETMERYNRHLSYAANGPYYANQIQCAQKMMDIIKAKGGEKDYEYELEDDWQPKPESFKHYVNMRNRARIPSTNYHGEIFWSEPQRLRFDKAWMLFWKILSERMMTWGD
ncbi:MAG: hypothetical protein IKX71_06885 [Bacteroidales bacterium]|nr:hypothetical protein [Bacteroidales bacterium]